MRIYKNLKKWFYIEHEVVDYTATLLPDGTKQLTPVLEYTVWHGRFITLPLWRLRVTVIYGLDFKLFNDPVRASEFLIEQKTLYKHAVRSKYKK